MFRLTLIAAAILPGIWVGCRSVPRAANSQVTPSNNPTSTQPKQPKSEILLTGSEQDVEANESPAPSEPTWLPSKERAEKPAALLGLASLESMALQNNPALIAAAARVDWAGGRKVQAGKYPNPVIGYHATEIGNLGTAGQQGGFLSQRFITGGKLELDLAIAVKEIDEARVRFHAQEQRVLNDVRLRFYDVLVAQRRVELTKEIARIGDNLVTATQKLRKTGLGTDNDLLQAEITADQSHILHDNARNQIVETWRRLAAVVGLPIMKMTPLTGKLESDLPSFDWDKCYAEVLNNHPDIEAARTRVERARIVIRRAQKEPIPNFDLSVSVRHHNITDSEVANVQLGIPIPFFDKNEGNIRSAEADWAAAKQEIQRIELDLQDRLAVVYRRYANARQQVNRYRDRIVPRAKQSLDLVTAGYEKGQLKYLTMLTAQKTYFEVNLSYLDSLRELRTTAALIEGQLLIGSLRK